MEKQNLNDVLTSTIESQKQQINFLQEQLTKTYKKIDELEQAHKEDESLIEELNDEYVGDIYRSEQYSAYFRMIMAATDKLKPILRGSYSQEEFDDYLKEIEKFKGNHKEYFNKLREFNDNHSPSIKEKIEYIQKL